MAALIRTSFSTVIRVNRDCSAAVFDERGQMLAQPDHSAPAHIGCMPGVMQRILQKYPVASIQPGDVFITNDPWIGAGHSPDIYIAFPVFRDGRLIGFTATVAHHLDIGGRVGSTDSQDVFEEGLLLPLLKIYDAGRRNDDVFRIIEENVRMPHIVLGDLDAQLAANRVGSNRMLELAEDYHLDSFVDIATAVTRVTEKAMKDAIQTLPQGIYDMAEELEVKDENGHPITIKAKIYIQGDKIVFDYEGTSPQVRRPINCVLNYTITFTALAMKMALVPNVPYNEGIQRSIVVKAPQGSILNARRPAAVWRRTVIGMRLPDMIFQALGHVMPEKIVAGSGSCPMWLWLFSGWRPDLSRFVFQTHFMGGLGARYDNDGLHAVSFPNSATDTPVEIFENVCPLVIGKRELTIDSGGAGQYRGGLGQEMSFTQIPAKLGYLKGDLTIAYSAGRLREGPEGLGAGSPGAEGEIAINGEKLSSPLATIKLSEQDKLTIRIPGGGGYHSPLNRKPESVHQDILDGFVSIEAAKEIYGVVLTGTPLSVDAAATTALRISLSKRGLSDSRQTSKRAIV